MTTGKAAEWVGTTLGVPCSPRTVLGWITTGAAGKKLAATRVGHRWSVSETDLRAFLGTGPRHSEIGSALAAAGW